MDGIRLDHFVPGRVYTVSSSIGAWLIAERYAIPEMRSSDRNRRAIIAYDRRPTPRRR
jgi:hypothetical protein